jgi:hypothetical protein
LQLNTGTLGFNRIHKVAGTVQILREGTWLYDVTLRCLLRVVRRDWDYHHEAGFDASFPDADHEGWSYYVEYEVPAARGTFSEPSQTCLSEREAMSLAEATVGQVDWSVSS